METKTPQIKISWDMKLSPEEILEKVDSIISKTKEAYDEIGAVDESQVDFHNVLKKLADIESETSAEGREISFPQHVSPHKEIRDASIEAVKKLQEFYVEMSMRQDIFNHLITLRNKDIPLDPEYQRYLEKLIKDGEKNALHLSTDVQEEIKHIQSRMNNLSIEFSKNSNEVNLELEFSEQELDGMSEDFLSGLKQEENGNYVVTLKYPHYFPVMRQAKNPETRQRLELAFNSQCMDTNIPILEELVELRHWKAFLLGFASHVDFVTDSRMAKSDETVKNFLEDIAEKFAPMWVEEKSYMLELKEQDCESLGLEFNGEIQIYDLAYYTTKVKEVKYSVMQEELRKYFPLPTLTQRLLEIYQEVLGLEFNEVEGGEVWHEDVRLFSVLDKDTQELLGHFFLDLFPREGKYGHAAVFGLQPRCLMADGTLQTSVAAMVANFTRPSGDRPALLDHGEVTTFFHEFGHLMHQICATVPVLAYFAGTRVERDFVEAPSQMLENWCWEPESLLRMSSHYLDGTPIPDTLLQSLVNSRQANAAYSTLRQIVLATFDNTIHSTEGSVDTQTVFSDIQTRILGVPPSPGTNFAARFGHLAGGYDAQYYGYMWSEVFSMDMFATKFKTEGILNPAVGREYRDAILSPGGTRDALLMLIDFLGREPSQDAFFKSKGLQV